MSLCSGSSSCINLFGYNGKRNDDVRVLGEIQTEICLLRSSFELKQYGACERACVYKFKLKIV